LHTAALKPIHHFGMPIELYVRDDRGMYLPYENEKGRQGCYQQAWSAAAALDLLTL
jgi:glycogen debranching enzyme